MIQKEDNMKRAHGVTDACDLSQLSYGCGTWCFTHHCRVRRCIECGAMFHTARSHKTTCSPRCRQRMSRRERGLSRSEV